jgi:penicillin-binding protein 2
MALQTDYSKYLIQQRLNSLFYFLICIVIILAARLWQLQIIQGTQYALKAERNRVRNIPVMAPRGTILDRNNVPLVENRPSFNVLLYRESVKDMNVTSRFIVEKLQMRPEELSARLLRNKGSGLYQPIVIKEDVGIEDISIIEAHKRDHPEIQLSPVPRRLYRYGNLASHVLGYVGEVSDEELSRDAYVGAKPGDLIGKSGVERTYNHNVTGEDGMRRVLVDSLGREVGLLGEIDSVVGGDLQLTLDRDIQVAADKLLENKVGAIVALNPRNGEILAMSSGPSFDPNSFSTRITEQQWNALINDPNRPLQNRAIQNAYSPGSTFKLIMAMAGLEEGLIKEDTHVFCTGSASFYNRMFHCWIRKGHGSVGLDLAISRSCNVFFYNLGKRMGIDRIAKRAQELGMGELTGVDLPGERSGLMPTPEWKQQVKGAKWYAGETISVSIGQGPVTTTPLQLMRAVSAIASNGRLITPHLLLRTDRPAEASRSQWKEVQLPIEAEQAKRVRDGMWGSVNNWGTGHNAAIPGLDICGKTGTVQVIGNERRKEGIKDAAALEDHSWFLGFAGREDPEIAVVVFVEHGGGGGAAAAPLAREVFRAYFAKKVQLTAGPSPDPQIAEVRR